MSFWEYDNPFIIVLISNFIITPYTQYESCQLKFVRNAFQSAERFVISPCNTNFSAHRRRRRSTALTDSGRDIYTKTTSALKQIPNI